MRVTHVASLTLVATAAYLAQHAATAGAGGCTNDEFVVDGTRVGIELCDSAVSGASTHHAGTVRVTASAHGRRLPVQSIAYEPVAAGDVARTIGNVSLAALGVARTLHLSLSVRGDDVRVEHALVLPGAIVLK